VSFDFTNCDHCILVHTGPGHYDISDLPAGYSLEQPNIAPFMTDTPRFFSGLDARYDKLDHFGDVNG